MRTDKRLSQKPDKKTPSRVHKRGIVGYSKKSALLEEAVTHMNTGKYGRSSAALKELLALDPQNIEARRLFATLHLRLGSLVTARQAFESLANEAIGRQDYWLAESLLQEYLAAGPRCVPFLEQLAQVHQEKGDEMAAVVELGKAIEILRDDPDPDNPQKAAQLYSKVRELAPASSVAFQLASLFDVQTGDFLVRPPTPSPSNEPAPANDAVMSPPDIPPQAAEHPLPEVMPWEVSEELPGPLETATDLREFPPPPAPEEIAASEAAHDETSFSFQVSESEPASAESATESPSDHAMPSVTTSEPLPETTHGTSSPMPWEQVADASVQIPEPQTPSAADGFSTLEAVLASLRTEDNDVVSSPANENVPLPASDLTTDLTEPPVSEAVQTASATLSAPMPWEQISDPAVEIPVTEDVPTVLPEESAPQVQLAAPAAIDSPAVSTDAVASPQPATGETDTRAVEPNLSPEPSTMGPPEVEPTTSFSWNSVFDKAWKLTAGTMAPSPTVPSEAGRQMFEESQPVQMQAAESSVVEPPAVAPPSAQEDLIASPAPQTPVSPPTTVSERFIRENVSTPPVDSSPAPAETSPRQETSAHWNTGEVAVQVHRPSKKKKRWEKEPDETSVEPEPSSAGESLPEPEPEAKRQWKSTVDEASLHVETAPISPAEVRPDWMQATEAITLAGREHPAPQARWSDGDVSLPPAAEAVSAAASAVDVLFSPGPSADEVHSHRSLSWSKPRPRLLARLHRVRIGIVSFIGSCFSTTRSLTVLALMITIATAVVAAGTVGAVAVMWMVMEEPPSSLYQTLTISPPRVVTDAKKNGYFLLMGFDAPAGQDPLQAGYERKADHPRDRAAAQVCIGEDVKASTGGASDHTVKRWIRSGDLLSNIKGQGATLKTLMSRESMALTRYQQWLAMPFDDWGFGQLLSPNCTHVLLAHRLYLLDGFNQDVPTGLDRLEADVQGWRAALGQSKTLAMKMLALTAVQDDASVATGLLSRVDLDGAALAKLSKMVRPLDQMELSIRWPMQSQFVWATKSVSSELRDAENSDRSWPASIAAATRLPVQRRANAYAEYYEAANKTVAGGRYTALPKLSTFVQTPPTGLVDYLTNPVEHIVGIEPLPSWDPYVMRMVEADAQLRLAGLQAWLRRGPQDGDVLMRLAKAGQAYYDPFTGLPMLVNQRKGVIYSVGRDGKDQEGDDVRDVTVIIPLSASELHRNAVSASSR
ncbi:MAG TPA: hypothetical protein VH332_01855 [Nitrospira sp.]